MDYPLQPVVSAWKAKIKLALDFKKKKFQDQADESMFFFSGPYDDLFGTRRKAMGTSFVPPDDTEDLPVPSFRMTVNKVAELVQLFGPALYHKNPVRQVNPRKVPQLPIELFGDPSDPMVAQQYLALQQQVGGVRALDKTRAGLLSSYLNYTPTALDLKTEARWAIDEALIKGMGCLWTELYYPAGSPQTKMVGSFFDSVDNLLLDPDMEALRDAKWIARRCIHPVWEVEQTYGLQPGTLKGNVESYGQQSRVSADSDGDYNRKRGLTNDLITYWKIYSKMGVGGRLSGTVGEQAQGIMGLGSSSPANGVLDQFGQYCFLVVADQCDYFLNLSPDTLNTGQDQAVTQALQWPTPFWADDAWPFTPIVFHWIPRQIWPMSHLKPAMGELKFIQWAYSMLASKIRVACRDFLAVAKSSGEEVKEQIRAGQDYTMLEITELHGSIDNVVKFLQHPPFHPDIFRIIQAVEANFEKRVGLTELMYGLSSRQLRSAAEAEAKSDQISVRPDDMANKVEDAMSEVARKEALAARWHLDQNDVQPVLGPLGAQWWAQFVMPSDPSEVIHQLEYRIEAGSAKKPNKERDAGNMQQAMQSLFQPFWQYAIQTSDFSVVNKLVSDWAKSIDLDPEGYLIKPPPMQPMLPMPQQQPMQQQPPMTGGQRRG